MKHHSKEEAEADAGSIKPRYVYQIKDENSINLCNLHKMWKQENHHADFAGLLCICASRVLCG